MIKAIIFDFGRVISAQKPAALFRRYEDELGLEPDTINRLMFDSDVWREAQIGRKTADEYWREIGPALGLHTPEAIAAFRQRYFFVNESLNEGVVDLIRRLRGRYTLAVLSNAPPSLAGWLADWGILDLFDAVIGSGDVGLAKPDPAIYRLTLDRLGVAPHEAVFIDDHLPNVAAARALGIHGIHFTTAEALVSELDRKLTACATPGMEW
jgi:putative hydrolase of the HAD superfamily